VFCELHDCYHQHFLRAGHVPTQKSKRARVIVLDDDSDDLPIVRAPLCASLTADIDDCVLVSDVAAADVEAFTRGSFALKKKRSALALEEACPPAHAPRVANRRERIAQMYRSRRPANLSAAAASESSGSSSDSSSSGYYSVDSSSTSSTDASSGTDGEQNEHYAKDECSVDYGSESDSSRVRLSYRKVYRRKLLPKTKDLGAGSGSDDDCSDDGDSAGSLAAFVVDDAEYVAQLSPEEARQYAEQCDEVQEWLMELRISHKTHHRDAFRDLLYYVARCVLDRTHANRLETATSGALVTERAFVEGRVARNVWKAPAYMAKALMCSSVWRAETVQAMNKYSVVQLRAVGDAALSAGERNQVRSESCSVCNRSGYQISQCVEVYGVTTAEAPHRAHTLYDDVRVLEEHGYSQNSRGVGSIRFGSARKVNVLCGYYCAQRLVLYHQLMHFWLKCAWCCYDTLKWHGLSPKIAADRILEGEERALEEQCWQEYQRVLDECFAYKESNFAESAYQHQ
jgi:hypothetical protein